jgi:hypothetical protein
MLATTGSGYMRNSIAATRPGDGESLSHQTRDQCGPFVGLFYSLKAALAFSD